MTTEPKLKDTFGIKYDVVAFIKHYDYSQISVSIDDDASPKRTLTIKLAPCYGKLDKPYLRTLDERLKIIIASTTACVRSLPEEDLTWDLVVAAMEQDPVLERLGEPIIRADKLIKNGFTGFNLSSDQGEPIVKEIKNWFTRLISDKDVETATPIQIEELAKIVARIGTKMQDRVEGSGDDDVTRDVVDIGILRYPDISNPYFKLYHIKLQAWATSSTNKLVNVQLHQNGITGEYDCRCFKPRDEIIDSLTKEAKAKAVEAAETIFDNM